jgi:hypothetical protein
VEFEHGTEGEHNITTGSASSQASLGVQFNYTYSNFSLNRALRRNRQPIPFLGGGIDFLHEPNFGAGLTFSRTPSAWETSLALQASVNLLRQGWQIHGGRTLELAVPAAVEASADSSGMHVSPRVGAELSYRVHPSISFFGGVDFSLNFSTGGAATATPVETSVGVSAGVRVNIPMP